MSVVKCFKKGFQLPYDQVAIMLGSMLTKEEVEDFMREADAVNIQYFSSLNKAI